MFLTIEAEHEQQYRVDLAGGYWDTKHQIQMWCRKQFGAHNAKWRNPRWRSNKLWTTYWFKYDRDRTLFVLRWS